MIATMTALLLAGVGSWSQASEEDRVARMVNEYRMDHGLPPVPFSRALTQVAVAHARDLEDHEPDAGTDGAGRRCTMHSWSRASGAKPVCYTADHARAVDMWNKPWEITRGRYKERGFEIAARYSEGIDADMAFDLWLGSPGHRAVILEQGGFRGSNWQAMGVAIDGRYAVVWFGKAPDPGR